MNAKSLEIDFSLGGLKFARIGLVFLMVFGLANSVLAQEIFESNDPVLISQPDSTRALAIEAGDWRAAALPKKSAEAFQPGERVVLFLGNVDLLPDEAANAFRVYGENADGKLFRFVVEDVRQLQKQSGILALTVYLFDPSGYNDQPDADGDILVRVSWRGNTSNRVRLGLGKTGGKIKDDAGAAPTPAASILRAPKAARAAETAANRKRFMEQATFGPNSALDFRIKQIGMRRWIDEQFTAAYPTIPYPNQPLRSGDGNIACGGPFGTSPEINRCHRDIGSYPNRNWMVREAVYGNAQLRRRVSWALHQIWVVSTQTVWQQRWTQEYVEILDRNSFGNYRDLIREMTLSPAMGEYLDMVRSTRQNPNENYARELLQLFTIGLYQLNQDGTLALDGQGNRIPTYSQTDIDNFTRVLTGWTHCNNGNNAACPNAIVEGPNYIDPMHLMFPNNHDQTAKTLLSYPGAPNPTIAACTNCTNDANRIVYANDSLNKTLDNIFYHPNVAPFVGKLLIQQLVTSDPTPAYVSRVAAAFNNNGAGVRGDMKAVIRAVLLDPEARGSRKNEPTYGKLREPLVLMTNFLRHFNARAGINAANVGAATPPASCQNMTDGVFDWVTRDMGQDVWNPPSVFNYYSPDYVVPGTDLLGPEFALANTGSSFLRMRHLADITWGGIWFAQPTTAEPYPYVPCGTSLDLSEPEAWATTDPSGNALIEGLNNKLMHGTMSEAMKSKIRPALNFPSQTALNRAKQAVVLVATSSQYQIQK